MLPYLFAIAIAIASLSLFFTAFFSPKWHRKDDFLWSGVGLIYALVLWICAEQIRGSVLLGQGAATVLVLSLIWQTVQLRKLLAISDKSSALTTLSFTSAVQGLFAKNKKITPAKPIAGGVTVPAPEGIQPNVDSAKSTITAATEQWADTVEPITDTSVIKDLTETVDDVAKSEGNIDNIDLEKTIEEEVSTQASPQRPLPGSKTAERFPTISAKSALSKPKKAGFSLSALFGKGRPKTDNIPNLEPESLTELLDRQDQDINAQKDADWDEETEVISQAVDSVQEPVEATVETRVEVTTAATEEEAEWDDVFEAIAPETQIKRVEETVAETIAPVQERVEAVVEAVTETIASETPIDEIKDIPTIVETEETAFLDQIKKEAEVAIQGSESEQKGS